MQPEFDDVKRFLLNCPPFDVLNDETLNACVQQLKAIYLNEQTVETLFKQHSPALYIVRSGGYDLLLPNGHLIEHLEAYDLFGYPSMLSGREVKNKLSVVHDGIVYIVPERVFHQLRRESNAFEQYFIRAHERRLLEETAGSGVLQAGQASRRREPIANNQLDLRIAEVIQKAPISLPSTASIQEAAQAMREHKVSSVMVVDDERMVGILTDRDLRNRVVAEGLPFTLNINAVMTQAPRSVYGKQTLIDALAVMTQYNVHHLPVLDDDDKPLGMLTNTDLMRQQRSEPVMLISALNKADSLEALVAEAAQIPVYMRTFAASAGHGSAVGRLLASLTDTMTRRLIELYEREHGVAPARYAWLAFGSQGREDQTLSSDQDNGLLLADNLTEEQLQWFAGLAEFVCQGLYQCGIPLCPGNIMASNPDCRHPLDGWLARFREWTRSPTPKALMYCQIFFDSRMVMGNKQLYNNYREQVAKLGQSEFFLGNLARLQNNVSVPLGLFNRFRGTESGKDSDLIDIKRYGIAVINDIVRTYSLHAGLTAPQTLQRLQLLQQSRLLSPRDNQALGEAWQFLTQLRLQHQLEVWGTDAAKNALDPDDLSTLTRRQLKSAFRVIRDSQQGVALKFGRGGA
ncbi:DUF294 nucleotidyltransferase-like domain-containing protein [Pseudidiomarina taiwanensis]|uniref:CBS domain-containing protein n=1 Tax=Pseudidiomarina taiwanensis TaxID=337250 RepID=A0A432ZKC7_9GAMM|nr:DUF294 nucleotidyltransferase-like domain-containing protein [Pseudidiomarina taiwanensis]RUO78363.1 hypothetical protein CWI83_04860 [Pseudidiomarina taiwanensis]